MEQTGGGLKILVVSNESSVLTELDSVLKIYFPLAEIIKETDPLMACKYSFNNAVNYVFAAEEMRRMSGSDLLQFIKKEHPAVKTYLLFNRERCPMETLDDDFDGAIGSPFSVEELTATIKSDAKDAN